MHPTEIVRCVIQRKHRTKRFLAVILIFAWLSFLSGCTLFSREETILAAPAPRDEYHQPHQRSLLALATPSQSSSFDPTSHIILPRNDKTITVYLVAIPKNPPNPTYSIFETRTLELYGSGRFDYDVKQRTRCDTTCTRPLLPDPTSPLCIAAASERTCSEELMRCNYPRCKIMVIGDENCRASARGDYDVRNYHTATYRQRDNGYLPLGPRLDSWKSYQTIQSEDEEFAMKPSSRRTYAFNAIFSKNTNDGRAELAEVLEGRGIIGDDFPHPVFASIASEWERNVNSRRTEQLPNRDYVAALLDSVFTLSPAGHNPECYRLFEAIEAGSIPVLVEADTTTEYVGRWCRDPLHHWRDAPVLVLDAWEDVFPAVERLMEDGDALDEMQINVLVWYEEYMRRVVREFEDFMSSGEDDAVAAVSSSSSSSSSSATRMAAAVDPCDDVVLFMPDANESLERQLNNYVLAAMLATFANKAMVVLDAPRESICPSGEDDDNVDYPLAFSSIVKSPEWLMQGCPVPCRATRTYADWDDFRRSDSPVAFCTKDVDSISTGTSTTGRTTSVFVVGGDETRVYFDGYFRKKIEGAPTSVSYDWAVRAGAAPREAEVFSKLTGEEMYDYMGALLVRSDVLRLQQRIRDDTNKHIWAYAYPRGHRKTPHDAMYVRRGEDAGADPRAKRLYVDSYWDAASGIYDGATRTTRRDYIPLLHYMRHYHDVKCSGDLRRVYIATDDPVTVRREVDELGPETGHGVLFNNCHNIKFTVSKVKKILGSSACAARYARTVADISDFIVVRTADTFVGEFNSDWGKLIRLFRLALNWEVGVIGHRGMLGPAQKLAMGRRGGAEIDRSPVLLKDTKVAWGPMRPLSPL